jgi:hypothetical protein
MTSHPELRASDADRRRVADVLRSNYLDGRLTQEELDERLAIALSARTVAELEALTSDLPREPSPPTPASSTRPDRKVSVHVVGGIALEERGRAREEYVFVTGIGGLDLDLSNAEIPPGGTTIRVYSVLGGVVLTVPEGVAVEHEGFTLIGGVDDDTRGAPPGAPVVRLEAWSVIGGIAVEPPRPRRLRLRRRRGLPLPPGL